MKRVGKPVFFIVLLLIVVITTLSITGFRTQYADIVTTHIKGADDIRWGIDIRGGVDVTFAPPAGYLAEKEAEIAAADRETAAELRERLQQDMASAESIIKVRLISQNITDYEVYTDYDKKRIIVRFPWKESESEFNPEQAIQELGETALLTFREVQDVTGGYPNPTLDDPIVVEGRNVVSATVVGDNSTGTTIPVVALKFDDEGTVAFADATTRLAPSGGYIAIWMDDNLISSPSVENAITTGEATISSKTNPYTVAEAKDLADKINAGALPFKLETDNYNTISPTLGAGARDAMILAGLIAFVLVFLFMVMLYRLPGFIATIGLAGQVGLVIASISGFFPSFPSFTLTLPGIAGIILSIGFGVDANIITAERIKEELRTGKTLESAINAGCKRAFTAILDGNITIIIVAVILLGAFGPPGSFFSVLLTPFFFMFGPATAGNIYSFGYTLLMGVLFNFVMSIYASRTMLKSISRFGPFKKHWLYGGAK